jgi:ubiquinone/menaquinone biosynthesis C-methylase UbiE
MSILDNSPTEERKPVYDPKKVKDHYDANPESEWERLQSDINRRVQYEVTKHILYKHLPPRGHILDAGSGPGRYAIDLAKDGYKVFLVDISEEGLRMAEEKIEEAGVADRITGVRCLDICDLSEIPDAHFNAVLCLGGALSYVRDKRHEAIDELIRVAQPGSPLIISVMSFLGTFHLISHFDAVKFLENIETHVEWDSSTPLPDYLNSKIGSNEWHAPMTLYTSEHLRRFFTEHNCEVLEIAAANTITSAQWGGLEKIAASQKATEMLIRLEKKFSTKPGIIDMGQHLIVAAKTPH